jgi:hypothetical protein
MVNKRRGIRLTYMGGAYPPSRQPKSQGLLAVSIMVISIIVNVCNNSLSSAKKFPRDIFWAFDLAGAGGGKSSAVLNHHECAEQQDHAASSSTRSEKERASRTHDCG